MRHSQVVPPGRRHGRGDQSRHLWQVSDHYLGRPSCFALSGTYRYAGRDVEKLILSSQKNELCIPKLLLRCTCNAGYYERNLLCPPRPYLAILQIVRNFDELPGPEARVILVAEQHGSSAKSLTPVPLDRADAARCSTTRWLHASRTAGRDRDHWRADRYAAAGSAGRA